MVFEINIKNKRLIFNSDIEGLKIEKKIYLAGKTEPLIYYQTLNKKVNVVELPMSTNTSTLIPALRVLSLKYPTYFDKKEVIQSQNNISFYWRKSKLASFYNKFSTDNLEESKKEKIIKDTVSFLISDKFDLKKNYLNKMKEKCKLLGFYDGFPVFDSRYGLAKLQSRLGIHIETDSIMISTPLDKYENSVYKVAQKISREIGEKFLSKKNRVIFSKTNKLLSLLGIK